MEKKKYLKPEIEVIIFSVPDIITGSVGDGDVPSYPFGLGGDDEEEYF